MRSGLFIREVVFAFRTQCLGLLAIAITCGGLVPALSAQGITPNLGEPQAFSVPEKTEIKIFSKTDKTETATAEKAAANIPQRYQRTGSQAELKNYYSELFGQAEAGQTPIPIEKANKLRQSNAPYRVQVIPATVTDDGPAIINAGYQQRAGNNTTSMILPVSAKTEGKKTSGLPAWARKVRRNNQLVTPVSAAQPATKLKLPAQRNPVMPKATLQINRQPVRRTFNQRPQRSRPTEGVINTAGFQNPSMKIEWKAISDISLGQECECELVISNTGDNTAYGVVVETNFPETVRLIDATPKPDTGTESTSWTLGNLDQGQTKRIRIKLIPSQRGPLAANAKVHFTGTVQSAFVVREPLLGLKIKGPAKVLVGDPASQSVTISNPGNGIAKNVRLEALIPAGLEHPRGEKLVMDLGSLNPGEDRTIRLALVAVDGGSQAIQVSATADGNLLQTAQVDITVVAPSLVAEINGPGLRYKGRTATYTLNVKNDGTVGTNNVRLMHKVPNGFEFISASRGASYDAPTRILSWFVGRLDANKSAEIKVKLKATQIGEFVHYVRTTSEHGSTTDSKLMTRVQGSPSLVMDIVDLDDPVEVGNETAYEIRVTNEGSADASNVGLSCELPAGVQFLSANGPTKHLVEGNVIVFRPLGMVKAGKTVTFRVHVVGNTEGNLRFRARMTSAASPEPLTFEESTHFYGDEN
ncbi:MAG: DUF11 domain-containing protein [Planctomycetaceae bacterium]|nr:DUF11 domain-containing protein [Planctomycetaceae bacterium]